MQSINELLATALIKFGIDQPVDADDIKNVKKHKSQLYALGPVYGFIYHDKHYYLIDDYSLDNNPTYIRNIVEEINHLAEGVPLTPPNPTSEDKLYTASINNTEYYLWESSVL
jgi:hypothetical protein